MMPLKSSFLKPARLLLVGLVVSSHVIFAQVADVRENEPEISGSIAPLDEKVTRLAELKADPALFTSGATTVYTGEQLGAIDFHVGSIGGGAIRLNGKGELFRWQTFNNLTELRLPDSFFAIRAEGEDGAPVVRALNTAGNGPFEAMQSLTFTGEFPFANYAFEDGALPIDVSMEAYSPFIPLDLKHSTMPVAVFKFTVTNPGEQAQAVSLLHSQQNAVGYEPKHAYTKGSWNHMFDFGDTVRLKADKVEVHGIQHPGYGQNVNQTSLQPNAVYVHLTGEPRENSINHGDMAIALLGEADFSAVAAWTEIDQLFEHFHKSGELVKSPVKSEPTANGETANTATAATFTLKPGERREFTALIAWHFPNGMNGGVINPKWSAGAWGGKRDGWLWGGKGNAYSKYWKNAVEVLKHAETTLEANERATRDFHANLYATSLPHWAKDRLSSQLAVLTSKTVFWSEDDYVGGWEGTGPGDGSCAGNCAHVWHYAQAHARLFPHLGRRMVEQQLFWQRDNGAIPYRQPNAGTSGDGQSATVMQVYREHLVQTDSSWLKENFPKAREAMDFFINKWDADRDGRLTGHQHTTLDCPISGNSSWMGSMYASALRSAAEMSDIVGDSALAASYRELSEKAIQSHVDELWNGSYFIQQADEHRARDYDSGSAIDQLLGQWWGSQLNFGPLYPEEKSRMAMQSLFKHNFRPDFHGIPQRPREFVRNEDAGMQMITWPEGNRPKSHTGYADEVMSGFEYAAIAEMLRNGLKEEAFVALKAIHDRYDGRLRQGYKGAWGNWGFSGNPFGDDECGKMYSRALANWSILLAYQGFEYDGPAQKIGFHPSLDEDEHRSFFTAAEGWGVFTQHDSEAELTVNWGRLPLKELALTHAATEAVQVTLDGESVRSRFKQDGDRLIVALPSLVVERGQNLKVTIR